MRRRLSGRVVYVVSMLMFFFKQKTAYEMRISDWSSDVCSSDLATAQVLRVKEHHPDATVVIAYPAETAVFLRDAHKYGLDGPFLATSSVMDMLDLAKRAGGLDAVQNVYVASFLAEPPGSPGLKHYEEIYRKYFPKDRIQTLTFYGMSRSEEHTSEIQSI